MGTRSIRVVAVFTALLVATATLMSVLSGCATSAEDLGYAVTVRDGHQELIIDLCGADPPDRLTVTRGPTGGIQDPQQLRELRTPSKEQTLFEVDESEWASDRRTIDLGTTADAPADLREFLVYTRSRTGVSTDRGFFNLPDDEWPAHPLALTSPFEFTRPVRLDTERGDLCRQR